MSKTLFQNAHVLDPANALDQICDVLVSDGKILMVGTKLEVEDACRVDCSGLYLAPGLVDIHCHLRDPGYEYKEDIASGTRAAAKGGFTSVCCMANTSPVNDNAAVTRAILEKAEREGAVRVYPIGAITKGLQGAELAEIGMMQEAGAVAISDDGKGVMNARMMYNAMRYASGFGMPVISHCEDHNLSANGCMNEGYRSTILGLRGIPRAAEEAMLSREILLAESLGVPVHIAHVSTRAGVALLRDAKKRGVRVTCETAPHYVALTDEEVDSADANTRVNPPLREAEDVAAIIEGLCDGTIDAIATDHAPHHEDEKRIEYELAASGISGFETALSVCYTALVASGHMTMLQLIEKMSCAPARILNLPGGTLSAGSPADIVLIDPEAVWTVDARRFVSKGKNTPFHGKQLRARVAATYVGGTRVYEEER